jgi:putative transcriptional regulator
MMEDTMFNDLLASVGEAKDILQHKKQPSRSFMIDNPDAKSIRTKLQLAQDEFAGLLNISVNTLRNWE